METREYIKQVIEQQRAQGFPAFKGAGIGGRIPLQEFVLNEVIRSKAPSGPFTVQSISILPNNQLVVDGVLSTWLFKKAIRIELHIAPLVDMDRDPILRIRTGGGLASIGEIVANLFKALPEGIVFSGGVVSVNLPLLLQSRGQGDLVRYLRRLTFSSQRGILFIGFDVRVP